jgi:hypothetical protein
LVRDLINRPNNVYGAYPIEKGRLTFRTGDVAMIQRPEADRTAGRVSTVCLFKSAPYVEFTGSVESAELVKVERPQEWQVVRTNGAVKHEIEFNVFHALAPLPSLSNSWRCFRTVISLWVARFWRAPVLPQPRRGNTPSARLT